MELEKLVDLITCGVFCIEHKGEHQSPFARLFSSRVTQAQSDVADVRLLGHIGAFCPDPNDERATFCPQHFDHPLNEKHLPNYAYETLYYWEPAVVRLCRHSAEKIVERAYEHECPELLLSAAFDVGIGCGDISRVRRHLQTLLALDNNWDMWEQLQACEQLHPERHSYANRITRYMTLPQERIQEVLGPMQKLGAVFKPRELCQFVGEDGLYVRIKPDTATVYDFECKTEQDIVSAYVHWLNYTRVSFSVASEARLEVLHEKLKKLDQGWKCTLASGRQRIELAIADHFICVFVEQGQLCVGWSKYPSEEQAIRRVKVWIHNAQHELIKETRAVLFNETGADWRQDEEGWESKEPFRVELLMHKYTWLLRHRNFHFTCESLKELRQRLAEEWQYHLHISAVMRRARHINCHFHEVWGMNEQGKARFVMATTAKVHTQEGLFSFKYLRIFPDKVTIAETLPFSPGYPFRRLVNGGEEIAPASENDLWDQVRSWGMVATPPSISKRKLDEEEEEDQYVTKVAKRVLELITESLRPVLK